MNELAIDFTDLANYKSFLDNLKENDLVIVEYLGDGFVRHVYRNVLAIRDDRGIILLTDKSCFNKSGIGINTMNATIIKPEKQDIENYINRSLTEIKQDCTEESFLTAWPKLKPEVVTNTKLLSSTTNFPFSYLAKHQLEQIADMLAQYNLQEEETTDGNISSEV